MVCLLSIENYIWNGHTGFATTSAYQRDHIFSILPLGRLLLGLTTTKRAVPAKSSLTLGCSHLPTSGQGRAQQTSKQNFFVIISPCKASNFGKDYKANKDSKTNKQSMTNKDSKANNKTNKNSKTFSRKTTLIDSPTAEVNVYGEAFNNRVELINLIFNTRIQEYGKNEDNTGEKGEEGKTSKNEDQVSRDPFNQQLSTSSELFLGSQVFQKSFTCFHFKGSSIYYVIQICGPERPPTPHVILKKSYW